MFHYKIHGYLESGFARGMLNIRRKTRFYLDKTLNKVCYSYMDLLFSTLFCHKDISFSAHVIKTRGYVNAVGLCEKIFCFKIIIKITSIFKNKYKSRVIHMTKKKSFGMPIQGHELKNHVHCFLG